LTSISYCQDNRPTALFAPQHQAQFGINLALRLQKSTRSHGCYWGALPRPCCCCRRGTARRM